jgi:hypothetical protein
METKDIWLLFGGAAIGYIINLISTFTAPPVGSALGKLKSGFIERNKARAVASYAEVRDLKSGEWDKYLYALNSWGFILVHMLFCTMCSIVAVLGNQPQIKLPAGVGAVFGLQMALRRTSHLTLTLNRIRNFEDYRAELLRRWPDIKLPEAE